MSRKSVVGLELEGNLCTKLPKLASFCCRHEWGAGEIENSFKFVQYKILEERMVLMRYRLKNLLLSKLTRKIWTRGKIIETLLSFKVLGNPQIQNLYLRNIQIY